jgi:hypothetical protein
MLVNRLKEEGWIEIHCDFCSESERAEDTTFNEAWDEWKKYGWRGYPDGKGKFEHKCPLCMVKFRNNEDLKRKRKD